MIIIRDGVAVVIRDGVAVKTHAKGVCCLQQTPPLIGSFRAVMSLSGQ